MSCVGRRPLASNSFDVAEKQYTLLLDTLSIADGFPRSASVDGRVKTTDVWDWTGGFFPGSLWYIYEYSKDDRWRRAAEEWTEALEEGKFLVQHHDVGFVMYCSYGNAIRLSQDSAKIKNYNAILVQSAESALTRYNPSVGLIKSWNSKMSWDGKTLWKYPVIIDNMMNLELLFYVSKITGDRKYSDAAISHANKTMANHFRPDYSTYHVIDYDTLSGSALHKQTNQGYSDNSTWSRGQSWAIYGYTLMYRETKDVRYLTAAKAAADFFLDHKNLPQDKVPFWDFNVGEAGYIPQWTYTPAHKLDYIPKDASAAAVAASALLELSTYDKVQGKKYFVAAEHILNSLGSPDYLATPGSNSYFVLKHSTGSFPHGSEIDVPLVYADYYFLEALVRYVDLLDKKNNNN